VTGPVLLYLLSLYITYNNIVPYQNIKLKHHHIGIFGERRNRTIPSHRPRSRCACGAKLGIRSDRLTRWWYQLRVTCRRRLSPYSQASSLFAPHLDVNCEPEEAAARGDCRIPNVPNGAKRPKAVGTERRLGGDFPGMP
jgi:hypothetical protein